MQFDMDTEEVAKYQKQLMELNLTILRAWAAAHELDNSSLSESMKLLYSQCDIYHTQDSYAKIRPPRHSLDLFELTTETTKGIEGGMNNIIKNKVQAKLRAWGDDKEFQLEDSELYVQELIKPKKGKKGR